MSDQLSTAAREKLLQTDQEYVARVLDGLYIAGWKGSQQFSEAEALTALKPMGVGRRALRRALDEPTIFPLVEVRRRRLGRPVQIYQLPSPREVAKLLGVEDGPGDELTEEDIRRGKYKLALHREMVKRRSGEQTSMDWMAGRLHVHRRTIRRFNRKLGVRVEQVFEKVVLTKKRAKKLPKTPEERTDFSFWLETLDGKRWRPFQDVVSMLRHMRLDILLVQQQPNRYWLPAG
jgi:hypothetical protein